MRTYFILAALVAPNVMRRLDDAQITKVKQDLRAFETALNLYTMDNYKKHRAARELPAGWDLTISMHYTTNGTAVTDHSKIGMTFAAKAPDRRLIKRIASPNTDRSVFFIPPGEPNWPGPTVEERFNVDAELVWLSPHMHLRGKQMAYTLIYPDGRPAAKPRLR